MWAIYREFLSQTCAFALKVLAACTVLGFVACRLDYPGFAGVLGLPLFGIAFVGVGFTSAHLQLFLSFPYSRARLIGLTAAINLTAAFFSLLTTASYFLILGLTALRNSPESDLHKLVADLRAVPLQKALNEVSADLALPSILASLLLLLSMLLTFSFMIGRKPGPVSATGWAGVELKSQYLNVALAFGLMAITFYALAYSSFLLYCLGFAFLGAVTASFLTGVWIQPTGRARQIKRGIAIFALAQALVLLIVSFNATKSENAKIRLDAIGLLGTLGPKPDPGLFAHLTQAPITTADIENVRDLFQESWWERGPTEIKGLPPYSQLIEKQENRFVLSGLAYLYPPGDLNELDLLALLAKEPAGGDESWRAIPGESRWLSVPLKEETVAHFIGSESRAVARFGLWYAVAHPSAGLVRPVLEALRESAPASELPLAVDALSMLLGRRFNLRTYVTQLHPKAKNEFYNPDCAKLGEDDLKKLSRVEDEPLFNRCLRENAVKKGRNIASIPAWVVLPRSEMKMRQLFR